MSRVLTPPQFPLPPQEYSPLYQAEIARVFSVFLNQFLAAGEGRNTFTVFTNLQTDDSGLETGAVFQHGGILRIPLADSPFVRGGEATGSVGSVTVSIS
tara:strand:- start:878 stop:1174 length:297 start_codon:yes stop_codon:yes gene_type:complete